MFPLVGAGGPLPMAFPIPPPPRSPTPRFSIRLCRRKQRKAAHQTWLVPDAGTAQKWATAINDSLKGTGSSKEEEGEGDAREDGAAAADKDNGQRQGGSERRQRRLLVLINPVSGTGGSRSIYNNTLRLVMVMVVGVGRGGGDGDVDGGVDVDR